MVEEVFLHEAMLRRAHEDGFLEPVFFFVVGAFFRCGCFLQGAAPVSE